MSPPPRPDAERGGTALLPEAAAARLEALLPKPGVNP
jgi:hypothetical protein